MHFYFKADPSTPARNSTSALASGVDVRGEGGFIIVAGATRADGVSYAPSNPPGLDTLVQRLATGDLPVFPLVLHRAGPVRQSNVVPLHAPSRWHASATTCALPARRMSWNLDLACARIASAPAGTRNDTLNREAFIAGMHAAAGMLQLHEASARLADAADQAGPLR